jgi:hypothetical protein
MSEPIFMELGMCILALEPISTAYFINPFHQSVCVARQQLGKNITTAMSTHTTTELLDTSSSMRSMSYQRKVGDWFFPELLVNLNIYE